MMSVGVSGDFISGPGEVKDFIKRLVFMFSYVSQFQQHNKREQAIPSFKLSNEERLRSFCS